MNRTSPIQPERGSAAEEDVRATPLTEQAPDGRELRTLPVERANPPGLSRRGQALVETALMLPIILILLLGAIDFGRLFFSWAGLHQAARIAANHASLDATTTSADVPAVIQTETDAIPCEHGTPTLVYSSGGTPTTTPGIGDYARVTLHCDFRLLTPLAGMLFGDPIPMIAVSTFPVRTGCVNCGPGTGTGDPPAPPPEQCRTIPYEDMEGSSVAGARLAWEAAGFTGTFTPASGSDYETVEPGTVVVSPLDPACVDPLAVFTASVSVSTLPVEGSPPGPAGCEVVPNLIGLTVEDARLAWEDSIFTGAFDPPPPDADPDAVVTGQTTSPTTSEPGVSCIDPATDIAVSLGDPWPDPPDAPCQVPHLIDKTRSVGESEWYGKGFVTGTFHPTNGNFTIKSQSLGGLSWATCDSEITVSPSQ